MYTNKNRMRAILRCSSVSLGVIRKNRRESAFYIHIESLQFD